MGEEFLELIPIGEAARRLERFAPVARRESLAPDEAVGRVLAQDLVAPEDLPAFPRALMDGFAVRASDVAAARETSPAVLERVGEVSMGAPARAAVGPGQAVAVPTGAMLPAGGEAVVPIEHTRPLGGRIEILRAAARGAHILGQGADLGRGALLKTLGTRLQALDLGALLAVGLTEVPVFARPRVAIVSSGDELVAPGQPTAPGQVRDTNALTLAAQVRLAGGEPILQGRCPDDRAQLEAACRAAAAQADLVLLSGGSSVGARDLTAEVLRTLAGQDLLVHGIALAPGKPTLAADLGGIPVLGLPGHPVSSFVVFHVLVRPLVQRLGGQSLPERPRTSRGVLAQNAPGQAGRETYHRVRLTDRPDGQVQVDVLPSTSAVYTSLLRSDGLLRVPAEAEGFAAGDEVDVEVLR